MKTPTQAEYWNGPAGDTWASESDALDPRLAHFGRTAMQALAPSLGERILDVGCGAGATSRELARGVGDAGQVTGVDISRPLLAVARSRGGGVRYLEADAGTTRFDEPFDGVYSRFGVMFFEDPRAAFANLRRAAPRGRLAFVCWRSPDENAAITRPLELTKHLLPEQAPIDLEAPGPFALARRDKIESILRDAGWRSITINAHDSMYELGPDAETAARFAMTVGPLSRALREAPQARDAVLSELRRVFAASGGAVVEAASTWVVTAR